MVHLGSGTGIYKEGMKLTIGLLRKGCTNRGFYHIVVTNKHRVWDAPIEQIGSFDPMPNTRGELLIGLNMDRLVYWLGHNPQISDGMGKLLGKAGILAIHPHSYVKAYQKRVKEHNESTEETKEDTN